MGAACSAQPAEPTKAPGGEIPPPSSAEEAAAVTLQRRYRVHVFQKLYRMRRTMERFEKRLVLPLMLTGAAVLFIIAAMVAVLGSRCLMGGGVGCGEAQIAPATLVGLATFLIMVAIQPALPSGQRALQIFSVVAILVDFSFGVVMAGDVILSLVRQPRPEPGMCVDVFSQTHTSCECTWGSLWLACAWSVAGLGGTWVQVRAVRTKLSAVGRLELLWMAIGGTFLFAGFSVLPGMVIDTVHAGTCGRAAVFRLVIEAIVVSQVVPFGILFRSPNTRKRLRLWLADCAGVRREGLDVQFIERAQLLAAVRSQKAEAARTRKRGSTMV